MNFREQVLRPTTNRRMNLLKLCEGLDLKAFDEVIKQTDDRPEVYPVKSLILKTILASTVYDNKPKLTAQFINQQAMNRGHEHRWVREAIMSLKEEGVLVEEADGLVLGNEKGFALLEKVAAPYIGLAGALLGVKAAPAKGA